MVLYYDHFNYDHVSAAPGRSLKTYLGFPHVGENSEKHGEPTARHKQQWNECRTTPEDTGKQKPGGRNWGTGIDFWLPVRSLFTEVLSDEAPFFLKSESILHHRHHPEGVVYRFNSGTFHSTSKGDANRDIRKNNISFE